MGLQNPSGRKAPMRFLAELAEDYERWAAEDEVIVTAIMNNLDRLPDEVRDKQLRKASLIAEEAQSLRRHAARLRTSPIGQVRSAGYHLIRGNDSPSGGLVR